LTKEPIVADGATIAPLQVFAERITILADHDRTGSYEVYVHDASEGAGPPPHFHVWDEAFYVIDGEIDFEVGGTSKRVKAGGFVHVPAGMVHAFRYASPTARMLGITSGAGATAMFADFDRECGADIDLDKVVDVLKRHRAELATQPG
jgi:quercetin dioxygenase-like cupin family protein